jgi:two-component system response regulator HydG
MAKILCVDDDPDTVNLKCTILEAAGYDVTPSDSARDAI